MRLPAREQLPRLYRVTAIAPSGAVVVGHLVGMRAAVEDAELCVAQGARPQDVTIEATGAGHGPRRVGSTLPDGDCTQGHPSEGNVTTRHANVSRPVQILDTRRAETPTVGVGTEGASPTTMTHVADTIDLLGWALLALAPVVRWMLVRWETAGDVTMRAEWTSEEHVPHVSTADAEAAFFGPMVRDTRGHFVSRYMTAFAGMARDVEAATTEPADVTRIVIHGAGLDALSLWLDAWSELDTFAAVEAGR